MGEIVSFRDLHVWQKAMDFVTTIYKVTDTFPKKEIFGLSDQLRRAAVSIPSNIAEGKQRNSLKEYIQFLYIAFGSCAEIYTQVSIARNLGYISEARQQELLIEVSDIERMLCGLIRKLKV